MESAWGRHRASQAKHWFEGNSQLHHKWSTAFYKCIGCSLGIYSTDDSLCPLLRSVCSLRLKVCLVLQAVLDQDASFGFYLLDASQLPPAIPVAWQTLMSGLDHLEFLKLHHCLFIWLLSGMHLKTDIGEPLQLTRVIVSNIWEILRVSLIESYPRL